jgi:hypothetical protein
MCNMNEMMVHGEYKKGKKGRISFLKCHERQFKAAPTVTSRPQNTRPHHQLTTLSIIIIISSPANGTSSAYYMYL